MQHALNIDGDTQCNRGCVAGTVSVGPIFLQCVHHFILVLFTIYAQQSDK